ncbi:hypothetical protein DPMN_009548 [Dreissena polymorpha]|uniref:Uncharacterized protein n=1 Tax=Dreissena polymorpha TaxID=45954 RepID=A0A9D4S081_DREPO|nr:hypothetical protein DPMN_009548 [Dreissena polymorpha]
MFPEERWRNEHRSWSKNQLDRSTILPNIHKTNVLTKFHDDWTKNVTSREKDPGGHAKNVSYRLFTCFHYIHIEKTAPPPGGHVFQMKKTPPPMETNVLTKFHEDWNKYVTSRVFTYFHYIEKTALPPGGHVFSPIWTIFELVQDINETNVFTKFHDNWAKLNTARPLVAIFELSRGIIGTNTRNVASRVFTRKNVDDERRTHARRTKGDPKSIP